MTFHRIIPCLLLHEDGFYKTTKFKNPVYLGDPINILKIFNEKEVDEIVVLDISVGRQGKKPNFDLLADMATECFMPLAYGGGVASVDDMAQLFQIGFEKVVLNTKALEMPALIEEGARRYGSQSIVVCIDVRKNFFGRYEVVSHSGTRKWKVEPAAWAAEMEKRGAGEIIVNSVTQDGTMGGYDLELTRMVACSVGVPVIASGGAGSVADFAAAIKQGNASACAAGAMFVFQGRHRAVLVNVPPRREIEQVLA
jgi:cyclase